MKFNFRWNPFAAKEKLVRDGRAANRAVAEFILSRAQELVHVDTGELRASGAIIDAPASDQTHVVFTAGHAAPQEFGFYANGTYVPPNPALRTAVAEAAAKYPQIAASAVVKSPEGGAQNLGVSFDKG